MPTPHIAAAFAVLFCYEEAPWKWSTFQSHSGLTNGPLDQPSPFGMDPAELTSLQSFLDAVRLVPSESQRISFVNGSKNTDAHDAGRRSWKRFINKVWEKSKLHSVIISALKTAGLHPIDLMKANNSDEWPDGNNYLPTAIDEVGSSLFGEECFPPESNRVRDIFRSAIKILTAKSWNLIRRTFRTDVAKLPALEEGAIKALQGKVQSYLLFMSLPIYRTRQGS
jgi:hypothetical protein